MKWLLRVGENDDSFAAIGEKCHFIAWLCEAPAGESPDRVFSYSLIFLCRLAMGSPHSGGGSTAAEESVRCLAVSCSFPRVLSIATFDVMVGIDLNMHGFLRGCAYPFFVSRLACRRRV